MHKTIFLMLLCINFKLAAQDYEGTKTDETKFIGFTNLKPNGDGTYKFISPHQEFKFKYKTLATEVFYGIELFNEKNQNIEFSGEVLNKAIYPKTYLYKDNNEVALYFDDTIFILNGYKNGDFKNVSKIFFYQRSKKNKTYDLVKQLNIDCRVRMYLKTIEREQDAYVLTDKDIKNKEVFKRLKK